MTPFNHISYLTFLWLLLLVGRSHAMFENEDLETYIIQLDHSQKPSSFSMHEAWHRSILRSLSQPVDDQEMLLYSYNQALHGFSARLTKSQLSEIEKSPAHIATYQESFGKHHTTHSTKFLGLNHRYGLWPAANYGDGVIIGVIDSGIWPESESFHDKGMPPVPKKWKGTCENGTAFSPSHCNRKLIGARSFSKGLRAAGLKIFPPEEDYDSARDFEGHGTHTSSTAAGNLVLGANCLGQARGTARGVAPRAHVAMYKAFFKSDENGVVPKTDVLAAMDQAIADGVDILSISLGFPQTPYYEDVIAIGALSAVEKGIFVSCSAGNDGEYGTVNDGAAWITTVGAAKLDRIFVATMTLDTGFSVEVPSYFFENIRITDTLFYYGKGNSSKSLCAPGALDRSEVLGKVAFCAKSTKVTTSQQVTELVRTGAYAAILILDAVLFAPINYTIPTITLPSASGALLREHLNKLSALPKVKSMNLISTKVGGEPAPKVASFSSRGPDPIYPHILKPDIIAPGVDILAAYVPNKPYMSIGKYGLVTDYALNSGTSMAAPHVAGVGALIKKVHPEWSPTAIRSALMTTAYITDTTPLAFGSGHIDPNRAVDPGLIYDMEFKDYVDFVCSLGYTDKQTRAVIRQSYRNCNKEPRELNYPSFIAMLANTSGTNTVKKYTRTVTNVGDDTSVYRATIENVPSGTKMSVEPSILHFSGWNKKRSYSLSLEIDKKGLSSNDSYALLKWTDQYNHVVSSPIMIVVT
ncbi:hypothetical protein K2173_026110 [Erythroxylum novogranatense]|uniref:Uncharacterized protein n=1 Tax=Erythroxylum novogranatense TaxID=1862640 RepID=A0AAV8SI17_9ROSI|nr:hypothetical protein K2173_026110 [Erythroxylum novogranatense]